MVITKFAILTFLSCTACCIKCIHMVVQSSLPIYLQNFFILPNWNFVLLSNDSLIPSFPQPLPITILLFVSMNLTTLVESYSICPFVTGLFHLAHLQGSSCCSMCQTFLPFKGWIIVHFMYISHLVYPLINLLDTFGYCE